MAYFLVKYIHIVGVLVLFSCLVIEHVLLKPKLTPAEMQRIAFADLVYGISALVVLTAGLVLWFVVGKDSSFYTSNPIFLVKVTLFLIVGLISIYPTIYFIRNRKLQVQEIEVPRIIIKILRAELALVLLLPLLAVLMAQGYRL